MGRTFKIGLSSLGRKWGLVALITSHALLKLLGTFVLEQIFIIYLNSLVFS